MITLTSVDFSELDSTAEAHTHTLPIEQTSVWVRYQNTIDGRRPWGAYLIQQNGELLGFISLIEFTTHGYRYLRSMHGPSWLAKPDEKTEAAFLQALVADVRVRDPKVVFLRVDTWYEAMTTPVLSTVPYDQTVVISLEDSDDEILNRMKSRGRRDVRKALRECDAVCSDETEQAYQDFSPYYAIMQQTAQRDGFSCSPMSDYSDMLQSLGKEHCRVFAARLDGQVLSWSIVTLSGTRAVRYYAGMRSDAMRMHVTDKLVYCECCLLAHMGIKDYDLMGIGSDFAPSLKRLNEFKTKFTTQITPVAAGRDIAVRPLFYRSLTLAKKLKTALGR